MRRALLNRITRGSSGASASATRTPHVDRTDELRDGPDLNTIGHEVSLAYNAYRGEVDAQRRDQLREVWVALLNYQVYMQAFSQAHEASKEVENLLEDSDLTKVLASNEINRIVRTCETHVQSAEAAQSAVQDAAGLTAVTLATALARNEVQRLSGLQQTVSRQATMGGVRAELERFGTQAINHGDVLLGRLHECWSAVKAKRAASSQQSLSKMTPSFGSYSRRKEALYFP